MSFEWKNKIDDVDDVFADDVNEIAQAVIQIESNKTTSISENQLQGDII